MLYFIIQKHIYMFITNNITMDFTDENVDAGSRNTKRLHVLRNMIKPYKTDYLANLIG